MVVNQLSREPVDGVEVRLISEIGVSRTGRTGADGGFSIKDLLPGKYEIKLGRAGFNDAENSGSSRHLTVQTADVIRNLRLEVSPTSVVSGRLLDQNRQPIPSAIVAATKVEYLNGRRVLAPSGAALVKILYLPLGSSETPSFPQTKTNSAGEYRIPGLDPGEYFVAVWQKQEKYPEVSAAVCMLVTGAAASPGV